jgi:hypothetical protein
VLQLGMWGRTIKFPIVPGAATMLHTSGKLLAWAANSTNASPAGTGYASMAADVIGLTASSPSLQCLAYHLHELRLAADALLHMCHA